MTTNLQSFQNDISFLATEVEIEWAKSNFDIEVFPQLTKKLLENFVCPEVPELKIFLDEVHTLELPKQTFPNYEFSDLPLTLARKERFSIDMYFWTHSDTNIHDHHFCGAFKIIKGNSTQIDYKFTKIKQLGKDLDEGKITVVSYKELSKDSTQAIELGTKFIHHVFHMDKLTITLCIRTDSIKGRYLNSYVFPKYKIGTISISPEKRNQLKFLELAIQCDQFPDVIPFDNSEILSMLYFTFINRLKIGLPLQKKFREHLEKEEFANDFFDLMESQSNLKNKLRIFGLKE